MNTVPVDKWVEWPRILKNRKSSSAILLTVSDMERFWSRVNTNGPNGCWEWAAYKNKKGYGKMSIFNTWIFAHRLSLYLNGIEIPDGKICCHRCDNPSCVNPEHLFLGTNEKNIEDAYKKGRLGSTRKFFPILTPDHVSDIVSLLERGEKIRVIAARFGVKYHTIYDISIGKTWKTLTTK